MTAFSDEEMAYNDDRIIAHLSRWVLGPHDAAVARLTGVRPVQSRTLEGDLIEDVAAPQLGMMVWKSGRTTGRTQGFIDGVKMTVPLTYRLAGQRLLQDVFRVAPLPDAGNAEVSDGGDSGAIWVETAMGRAVGLHFAGNVGNSPEYGLAHEIRPVIQRLGVRFPAQPAPAPGPEPVTTPSFWQRFVQFFRRLFRWSR